jgi:hypothetical protein
MPVPLAETAEKPNSYSRGYDTMDDTRDNAERVRDHAEQAWKERLNRYREAAQRGNLGPEFDDYLKRIRILFENERLRNWAFAPFRAIFNTPGDVTASQVRQTITGIALANAVIAALPGKLGLGVLVSMALEAYMAYKIAQHLGLTSIRGPQDALRSLGALAGTVAVVFWLFKQLLGFAFSLFNMVGLLPATFLAELFVTDLVGILLWVGFREIKKERPFSVPTSAVGFLFNETRDLLAHQWRVLSGVARPSTILIVGRRLKAWFTGDVVLSQPRVRDDEFVAAAMVSLLAGREDALDGPAGRLFLQSIRELYPVLQDADVDTIATHFRQYDERQMAGVLNQIKGRLHELMVEANENADGDEWTARLHDDPYHPSTDIIYESTVDGRTFEFSLKATDSRAYVEHALLRYPSDPVMVTSEVAVRYEGDGRVTSSGIANDELEKVTAENFDRLFDDIEPANIDILGGALTGTALGAAATLWPFVAAWMSGRITREQLEAACVRVLGASGLRLVPRLVGAIALGPIYMWYALARGVISLSDAAHELATEGEDGSHH